jgi:hypothetical protein
MADEGNADKPITMLKISDEVRALLAEKAEHLAAFQEAQADALKKSATVERQNGKLIAAGFTANSVAGW